MYYHRTTTFQAVVEGGPYLSAYNNNWHPSSSQHLTQVTQQHASTTFQPRLHTLLGIHIIQIEIYNVLICRASRDNFSKRDWVWLNYWKNSKQLQRMYCHKAQTRHRGDSITRCADMVRIHSTLVINTLTGCSFADKNLVASFEYCVRDGRSTPSHGRGMSGVANYRTRTLFRASSLVDIAYFWAQYWVQLTHNPEALIKIIGILFLHAASISFDYLCKRNWFRQVRWHQCTFQLDSKLAFLFGSCFAQSPLKCGTISPSGIVFPSSSPARTCQRLRSATRWQLRGQVSASFCDYFPPNTKLERDV